MSEFLDKEVYFDVYCQYCVHHEIKEMNTDEPAWYTCSECLSYPSQQHSHKPLNFVKRYDIDDKDIRETQEELHGAR